MPPSRTGNQKEPIRRHSASMVASFPPPTSLSPSPLPSHMGERPASPTQIELHRPNNCHFPHFLMLCVKPSSRNHQLDCTVHIERVPCGISILDLSLVISHAQDLAIKCSTPPPLCTSCKVLFLTFAKVPKLDMDPGK